MSMSAWHWQERYDNGDPEKACRQQVLQVQREIPFEEWLQQKKATQSSQRGESSADGNDEGEKRCECEKRFREWVRNKQREKKKTKQVEAAGADAGGRRATPSDDQPYSKPPSLHVNPRRKGVRGESKKTSSPSTTGNASTHKKPAPREQCVAAYSEWERRKRREDPIKRKHRQLNQQLQEHAQRLLHLTIWKKKDVVCAYSTNRRAPESPSVASNKLRAA